jgi:hypothetical protein
MTPLELSPERFRDLAIKIVEISTDYLSSLDQRPGLSTHDWRRD